MKTEILIRKKIDVKYVSFEIPIVDDRDFKFDYCDKEWVDNVISDGKLKLIIELDTGKVINWICKDKIEIYAKPIDEGIYCVYDENMQCLKEYEGYVPSLFSCVDEGYGDYLSMVIHSDGSIENWNIHRFESFMKNINDID